MVRSVQAVATRLETKKEGGVDMTTMRGHVAVPPHHAAIHEGRRQEQNSVVETLNGLAVALYLQTGSSG